LRRRRNAPRKGASSPSPRLRLSYAHILVEYPSFGTARLLPLPACGERVGVRGPLRESELSSLGLRLAERPPHPARKGAPTSPRTAGRGEGCAA